MKRIILIATPLLIFLNLRSFSQHDTCCREIRKKIKLGTAPRISINFNGMTGSPEVPVSWVPYGSYVDIKVQNVNPLAQAPSSTLSFRNFGGESSPDLENLFPASGKPPATKDSTFAQTTQTINQNNEQINNSLDLLVQTSEYQQTLMKGIISTKSRLDSTKNKKEILELKQKINKLTESLEKSNEKIDILNKNIDSLQKQISALSDKDNWTKEALKAYSRFIEILDSLSSFASIQPQFNNLLKNQFIPHEYTDSVIDDILTDHIPGYTGNTSDLLKKANDFIRSSFDEALKNYSIFNTNFEKLNKLPVVDSFEGKAKVELTKESTVDIQNLKVFIKRDAVLKPQKDFLDSKIGFFKNDSLRTVYTVQADTLLEKIRRVRRDDFSRTLKSFQANADEITVNVPFAGTEPYIIKTYCRFRVNGSTGLLLHFGKTDDMYKPVKDSSGNTILIRQRSNGIDLNLGFLAQFYNYDQRKSFNWGGVFGITTGVAGASATGKIVIVGGLCFNATTIDKLSFNIGLSYRKSQLLNTNNLSSLSGKNTYRFNNPNDTEPTYDSHYRLGIFFGVSWGILGNTSTQNN